MTSQSFDFMLGKRKRWAQAHANKHPSVTLALPGEGFPTSVDISVSMSPAEARAMASSLYAAADYAENVIPDTGLGESAVEFDAAAEAQRVRAACGDQAAPRLPNEDQKEESTMATLVSIYLATYIAARIAGLWLIDLKHAPELHWHD